MRYVKGKHNGVIKIPTTNCVNYNSYKSKYLLSNIYIFCFYNNLLTSYTVVNNLLHNFVVITAVVKLIDESTQPFSLSRDVSFAFVFFYY